MDVAIAALTRAALRYFTRVLATEEIRLPSHAMLASDLDRVIESGRHAQVEARHLAGPGRAGGVLEWILERARPYADPTEKAYFDLVGLRIDRGSLAERILGRLRVTRGDKVPRTRVRDVYEELALCLATNRPWET